LDEPCSIFRAGGACTPLETFSVIDFGIRFILHYELSLVVWMCMRRSHEKIVAFHKILLGTNLASLVSLVGLQSFHHPESSHSIEFDPKFFKSAVICHLMAASVSLWVVLTNPSAPPPNMKWSIPGNALYFGGVRSSHTRFHFEGCESLVRKAAQGF
jgi:hypothetical protein